MNVKDRKLKKTMNTLKKDFFFSLVGISFKT